MIGLNVLANFVRDRAALSAWLKPSRPGAVVVMDDAAFAQQVKRDVPAAVVIHRTYHPDDHRWHEVTTPRAWLDAHQATGGNGVIIQCLNEPSGYTNLTALVTWCVDVMKQAHDRGIALCLPNFAVGHPDTALVANGALDGLLRALAAYPEMVCGLHEYWRNDPTAEPYLIGRFRAILDRARVIGVDAPRIVLTEYGRDVAGGLNDGWRGAGLTEERYAELLTTTHKRVYAPYNIPACVFGYGRGADDEWQSFSVEGADTVLRRIAEYNRMAQPQTDQRTAIASIALRLRPEPGTTKAAVTTIPEGAEISVWLSPVEAKEGYDWVNAQWGEDKGWIILAYKGAPTFVVQPLPEEPPPVDPDPPPIFSVWLTIDELRQSLALELEAAQLYDALKANAQKKAALLQVAIDRAG